VHQNRPILNTHPLNNSAHTMPLKERNAKKKRTDVETNNENARKGDNTKTKTKTHTHAWRKSPQNLSAKKKRKRWKATWGGREKSNDKE
jgi:hypothetical protein